MNLFNQIVYQFWKKMQSLILNTHNPAYETRIEKDFEQKLTEYHKSTQILSEITEKPFESNPTSLFLYPFERH